MNTLFKYEDGETGNIFHVLVDTSDTECEIIDVRADDEGSAVGKNLVPFLSEELLYSIQRFADTYTALF